MRRAHGKLLLTGEYFVLDGALALAMPVRFGQSMTMDIRTDNSPYEMRWVSQDEKGDTWFSSSWKMEDEQVQLCKASDEATGDRLLQLFRAIEKQDKTALQQLFGVDIYTRTDFPRNWGLGTSSTLVSLLAQSTKTNPYQLLADSFGGSGYDIACATAETPILYHRENGKAVVEAAHWQPSYTDHVYFAFLGQKQNSREGIRHYRELGGTQPTLIDQVTDLTNAFLDAHTLSEAQAVLEAHEDFISEVLQMPKVKEERFADFSGTVKSLGAWGGDFVMILSDWPEEKIRSYFKAQGCPVVFSFAEMALPKMK